MTIENHMEKFEKEEKIKLLWNEVKETGLLYYWKDFETVAGILIPEIIDGAFERRPCRRKLRYLGEDDPSLVKGNIYHSIDFNGATYTLEGIEGYSDGEKIIGCAYFEWIKDVEI